MNTTLSPMVTGVLTTYERSVEVVKRALLSMINQTYDNLELILVNDSPNNQKLVKEIRLMIDELHSDRKILYCVPEANGGACKARNIGISHSNGEFIAFLDDDDVWNPDKIEAQVSAAVRNSKACIVYSNVTMRRIGEKTIESLRFTRPAPSGYIYAPLISRNLIGSCSFPLFRKRDLVEVGGFDEKMPALQDWDLYLRLLRNGEAVYINQTLATYSFYKGNRISTNPNNRIIAFERLRSKLMPDLVKLPKEASEFYLIGSNFYSNAHQARKALHYFLIAFRLSPKNFRRNNEQFIKLFVKMIIPTSFFMK